MTDLLRYRLDDLRRLGSALGVGVGLSPPRALALAGHLLWFDAAGAPEFGIATLPDWLDRTASRTIDPTAEETVVAETLGTATLDGGNGIGPLVLARAGALAIEKARDAGVGLVRVTGTSMAGPGAVVAAEMAVGPFGSIILGPGPSWAMALPGPEGPPAVFDSTLAQGVHPPDQSHPRPLEILNGFIPWATTLLPDQDRLVAAVSLKAIEPLSSFHERVATVMNREPEGPGRLLPIAWESRRREAREHGVAVTPNAWARLMEWAQRFEINLPSPAGDPSPSYPASGGVP